MNAVAIGPFVFASEQFAALLGIFAFTIVTTILARRVDPIIGRWSSWALIAGFVAARLGHVALHWQSFMGEPLRAFAFWQGGFQPVAGLVGVLVVSAFFIRSLKAGLAAAAAFGLSLVIWVGVTQLTSATLGQPAPTVTLHQMDGPPIAVSDVAGKPAVINLWASWCPPCRREMPLLAEVAASRDDVVFLFINQGEGADTIRSYLAKENLKIDRVLLDPSMQIPRHYGSMGLPITLFLRADGTLASMHMGEISREALNAAIERLGGST
ncbi:MAG: thiol:disulfide interchange protein [Rhizobiales bacterium 24-66-13]|jgi:thiol-disulfide isomerase/thioredoxin|nr:MAG: thiol:disulfide interchange protein [Rhizobiales bacterium 35-66-30]OYZ80214.1 MAG: thiol:disulfide interchange protein [Rhizobiales bacterium 24-66-13]OZB08588.1 MAG: thiol:disulfide interchange protein [Rhizobiales bacterium 39-66-18]HQS47767.1 TlpA disulfide reductase family protein [Xanthobacteraceae bacterium]